MLMRMSPDGIGELAKALSKASLEFPAIHLDKTVNYKNVRFDYASLSNMISKIKPVLSKHGLSLVQFPVTVNNELNIESMLIHDSGQFLLSSISQKISSTDPKDLGSTITYLRRYSYGSILGIALDSDLDAELISEKYIGDENQKAWLREVLSAMGVDNGTMHKVAKVMVEGNFEANEISVKKALEALRK